MKIQSILLISHTAVAGFTVLLLMMSQSWGTYAACGLALGSLLVGALFASFALARWMVIGLQQLELARRGSRNSVQEECRHP